MSSCPTVIIKVPVTEENPSGEVIINQSDYDANPSAYVLASAPAPEPERKPEEVKHHAAGKTTRRSY